MAARAIWKGVLCLDELRVPVKLYSAIENRNVHFRLLHSEDKVPVKQEMVNPETDSIVPYDETLRAYETGEREFVLLDKDELEALHPAKSRNIEIEYFLSKGEIDHRWYDRPYYLGPDGDTEKYFALASALENSDREGLAHWVMRNKEYTGSLQLYQGYPMLMTLRPRQEVIPVEALKAPSGKTLDKRELDMARQLIGMLEADFDPGDYRDEYRERVIDMLERKQKGQKVKITSSRSTKPSHDLTGALEKSLKHARNRS